MTDLLQWRVGDVRITRVQELQAPGMGFILPQATVDNLAEIDWVTPFLADSGEGMGSVHALIIEVDDRLMIVDTCVGNDKERRMKLWSHRQGLFLDQLAEAGFAAERIDTVICTHLHTDHVGWNTRLVNDAWVPTFANARYLLGRAEWEHWSATDEHWTQIVIDDSVRPLFDADKVDLVSMEHVVHETIWLEPTPGHTPGHVSVHITSNGAEAVITGDLVHHPSQFARPDWGSLADADPEHAERTRKAFMERYADTPILLAALQP
ncbi:hypothetical protein NKDENANG_03641 [Candidatus Entotheonellaceae bacterium PAL068K]